MIMEGPRFVTIKYCSQQTQHQKEENAVDWNHIITRNLYEKYHAFKRGIHSTKVLVPIIQYNRKYKCNYCRANQEW